MPRRTASGMVDKGAGAFIENRVRPGFRWKPGQTRFLPLPQAGGHHDPRCAATRARCAADIGRPHLVRRHSTSSARERPFVAHQVRDLALG